MFSNKKLLPLLFFLFLFVFPFKVNAQIIINEVSSNTSPDWVEIFNNSTDSADLSLYKLVDYAGNNKNLEGILVSEAFLAFDWGNRLDNDGDIIKLIRISDNAVIDSISYGDKGGVCKPDSTQSTGRVDNGNTIERFSSSSKNLTNQGVPLNPCPTPSPSPTESPTQESTTALTSTPTPTKTPSPVPTATKKPTTKPSASPVEEEEIILNESFVDVEPSSTPEGLVAGTSTTSFPYKAVGLVISGLGFMGYGAFSVYKKNKKGLEVVTD